MKKKYESKNNAADLQASIKKNIENLAKLTSEAAISEVMQRFLDVCSRFYQYSEFNQWLIFAAMPDATRVAGYRKWNEFNRYVRKGEHGIPILAPCIYKQDPDNEDSPRVLKGFRVVYVFDVSQTDGEPLPDPPDWKSPARQLELENRLVDFAESQGISVDRGDVGHREAQGVSKGGSIILAEEAGTKTLIHEIAHELLHQKTKEYLSREVKELEAEAVAFVVASHFELPDLVSPNYLALWDADSEKILERQERIRTCAADIITAISD